MVDCCAFFYKLPSNCHNMNLLARSNGAQIQIFEKMQFWNKVCSIESTLVVFINFSKFPKLKQNTVKRRFGSDIEKFMQAIMFNDQ